MQFNEFCGEHKLVLIFVFFFFFLFSYCHALIILNMQ